MKKYENIENLKVFCETVNFMSVKRASLELGVEPSNAFRTIRQLEHDVGVPLFNRQTRPMRLTKEGEIFYRYASGITKLNQDMLAELEDDVDKLAGRIRVSSTAGFRQVFLTPALVEFQMSNPDIVLELHEMTTGVMDVLSAASGNDVVMTYMPTEELPPGMVVRECGEMPFIACASLLYLQRFGEPESPSACAQHLGVLLNMPNRRSVTYLTHGSVAEKLEWKRSMTFNSQINARDAMVLGGGIIPDLAFYFAIEGLHDGQIQPVMRGWSRPPRMLCLFAPGNVYRKRRVRYFLDWLEARVNRMMEHTAKEYRWVA